MATLSADAADEESTPAPVSSVANILKKIKLLDLTGKVSTENRELKGAGAFYDVFCGDSPFLKRKVAIRRLRFVLTRDAMFAKVRRTTQDLFKV